MPVNALKEEAATRPGCIQLRRSRQTGHLVGVYRSDEAGIESDPELPYTTVCEEHSTCVCHTTRALALALAPFPAEWCEECQAEQSKREAEQSQRGAAS